VEKSLRRLYPDPEHRMRISASDSTKKGYESITADKRKEVEGMDSTVLFSAASAFTLR
jgi:hypothetical protein